MTSILETDRLYLRELCANDSEELSKVLSDRESMQFYPHPFSQEEVMAWINRNIERYRNDGFGLWAVILKESGAFVGDCGITLQNIDGVVLPEIGFHILPAYRRQGFATEAALACKQYALSDLGFSIIYSYSQYANHPSQRVAQKIGLQLDKTYTDTEGITHVIYCTT